MPVVMKRRSLAMGWCLAICIIAAIREKMTYIGDIPGGLKGAGITMIVAGILALAFMVNKIDAEVFILRPEGGLVSDIRPMARINISVIVEENGRRESGGHGGGGRFGLSGLIEPAHWQPVAREALRIALVNLRAEPAPAGVFSNHLVAPHPKRACGNEREILVIAGLRRICDAFFLRLKLLPHSFICHCAVRWASSGVALHCLCRCTLHMQAHHPANLLRDCAVRC